MSKQTRKERKEEERRIIAEMEAALKEADAEENVNAAEGGTESVGEEQQPRRFERYADTTPKELHCRKCRTLMENGVCPTCGYKVYIPMDKKKQDKIRLIVAGVLMAACVILFVVMQIVKK